MAASTSAAAQKFDPARAGEYEAQSRVALAGYDACHELTACMLAASLGSGTSARILVADSGGMRRIYRFQCTLAPTKRRWRLHPSELLIARRH